MKYAQLKQFSLNFGPQHPAAHGVSRLIPGPEGETIRDVDPHIGLSHRGTEKSIEYRTVYQNISYFDRLDYVSMMSQEHVFCTIVERLLGLVVPRRAQFIRVLFLEITRISNHLLAITTHALDVGALTPFPWGFEEREKLLESHERVSGSRMHSAYFRPGGVSYDIHTGLCQDIHNFAKQFSNRLDEIEDLLNNNRIWKQRLINIGCVSLNNAMNLGFSGPLIRGSGSAWDLRRAESHEVYNELKFKIPCGMNGDCYDRYLLRIEEMRQSLYLVEQCLNLLPEGTVRLSNHKYVNPSRTALKFSMEALIAHFKLYSEGILLENQGYFSAEAPKGELGVFIHSNGTNMPNRCKIRSPGFFHLHGLGYMVDKHLLADLVTVIGTQDIVSGEIDR